MSVAASHMDDSSVLSEGARTRVAVIGRDSLAARPVTAEFQAREPCSDRIGRRVVAILGLALSLKGG